jgi:hypothetical protein
MRANAIFGDAGSLQKINGPKYRWIVLLWQQLLAFFAGFSIQFNMLIGGSGAGAVATGGYGYRLTDFVALTAIGLLGLYSITTHRLFALGLYGLIVAALLYFPVFSPDPRTSILAQHYAIYSLAALYLTVLLVKMSAINGFCWGLILGLVATLPIFVLQDSGYTSTLIEWGLVPGYSTWGLTADSARYAGLMSHPNEAGHVAALAAAAAAYLAVVHRRFLPLALVAASLLVIFYYTLCRGSLLAGGTVLAISLLFSRGRFEPRRLMIVIIAFAVLVAVSNMDFVTSRFENDQNLSNNIQYRIDSTLYGLHLLLTYPFGLPIEELSSILSSGTGGIGSVHNGFIFFGLILGLLPLTIFLMALLANVYVRNDTDVFFALLTLQVSLSFMFEQLSGAYSYAFIVCIIISWAFLKTSVGATFKSPLLRRVKRGRETVATTSGTSLRG